MGARTYEGQRLGRRGASQGTTHSLETSQVARLRAWAVRAQKGDIYIEFRCDRCFPLKMSTFVALRGSISAYVTFSPQGTPARA